MQKRVSFYSKGIQLAGLLHLPDNLDNGKRHPAIVFSHGYTGSKEGQVARHAQPFVNSGYVCLTFDHRGFGESHGPRGRLMCHERVDDVTSAITFLQQQPEVEKNNIGLYGLSVGAAVVLYAALDERVKCVVSGSSFGSGERWLRSLRRYWEWNDFLKQLEEDRIARVMTGRSRHVDALDIVVPSPDVQEYYVERRRRGRADDWNRPLESADSILDFKPEEIIGSLPTSAVLLVHGAHDNLVPVEEAYLLYAKAKTPKHLAVIQGATHVAMYQSPFFEQVAEKTLGFADANLR